MKTPAELLRLPLLGIEWDRDQGVAPGWAEWAEGLGLSRPSGAGQMSFSLSSAAIDAAINARGFVLAQVSMAADDLAAGRLVVPFEARMKLAEAYFLAWDLGVLEKPLGAELHKWLAALGKQQDLAAGLQGW